VRWVGWLARLMDVPPPPPCCTRNFSACRAGCGVTNVVSHVMGIDARFPRVLMGALQVGSECNHPLNGAGWIAATQGPRRSTTSCVSRSHASHAAALRTPQQTCLVKHHGPAGTGCTRRFGGPGPQWQNNPGQIPRRTADSAGSTSYNDAIPGCVRSSSPGRNRPPPKRKTDMVKTVLPRSAR